MLHKAGLALFLLIATLGIVVGLNNISKGETGLLKGQITTGDLTCPQSVCNIWHDGSTDSTCKAKKFTIASGERCTYTGFVENAGLVWKTGDPNHSNPDRRDVATLSIIGNNCTEQTIDFPGCGQQALSITCDTGEVVFATDDSSFAQISESCIPYSGGDGDGDGDGDPTDPLAISIPSQTISLGETPQNIVISGGTPGYAVINITDNGTGLTAVFDGNNTLTFSNATTGVGTLQGTVTDAGSQSVNFSILVSEQVDSFSIDSSCAEQTVFVGDTCVLVATAPLSDGSTRDISAEVTWQGFEGIGEVTNNVLEITKRDAVPRTTAVISASKETVASDNTFNIFVEERVPIIESVETLGNFGVERATTETLYIRVSSEQGQASLQDVEVWFVEGAFSSPESIPQSAQRFAVSDSSVPPDITEESTVPITVLLKLPIFIPDFAEMDDGPFTFLINIHTSSGNVISAVEPSFLGRVASGDANGDGDLTLVDAILILKMANREIVPTSAQLLEVDFNKDSVVTVLDAIYALRLYFSS